MKFSRKWEESREGNNHGESLSCVGTRLPKGTGEVVTDLEIGSDASIMRFPLVTACGVCLSFIESTAVYILAIHLSGMFQNVFAVSGRQLTRRDSRCLTARVRITESAMKIATPTKTTSTL